MKLVKILAVCMVLFGIMWLILNKQNSLWKRVTNKIEGIRDRYIILFLAFATIILEEISVLSRKLPFVADEVYSISGAAFFAGYDWSDYMSLHKFYNFGYTMLFAPLYKIFDNPVTIYRGMLFGNVLVFTMILIIVYYIARNHLKLNKVYSIAMSVMCSYNAISLFFKGYVYNELPLAFIMWLTVLLLFELIHAEGKKRIVLSLLTGGIVAYSYLVHSRCLILFVALAIVVICYLLVYKKWIVQPVSFTVVFAIAYFFEKQLLNYVQANLYLQGLDVNMPNSVEHMATGTWQYRTLTSLEGIGKLIMQFFSLAGTLSIETGGLITVVSAASLYFIWKNFKRFRTGKESKELFLLTIFSFVAFWGMVVCIALFGASNGKIRFLLYSRYFAPFIGPFLLLGLLLLKKNKDLKANWVIFWSFVLNVLVVLTFVFYTLPRLNKSSMKENASLYLFMPFARYIKQTTFSVNVIFIALFLLVAFTCILLFLYKRKQFVAFCIVGVIFSTVLVRQVDERQSNPASERRYNACNATYELLQTSELFLDKEIYCVGDETYRKAVLVSCYDKDLNYTLTDMQMGEDSILLVNDVDLLDSYEPSYVYKLDSNEWIGLWDEELNEYLSENYEEQILSTVVP